MLTELLHLQEIIGKRKHTSIKGDHFHFLYNQQYLVS